MKEEKVNNVTCDIDTLLLKDAEPFAKYMREKTDDKTLIDEVLFKDIARFKGFLKDRDFIKFMKAKKAEDENYDFSKDSSFLKMIQSFKEYLKENPTIEIRGYFIIDRLIAKDVELLANYLTDKYSSDGSKIFLIDEFPFKYVGLLIENRKQVIGMFLNDVEMSKLRYFSNITEVTDMIGLYVPQSISIRITNENFYKFNEILNNIKDLINSIGCNIVRLQQIHNISMKFSGEFRDMSHITLLELNSLRAFSNLSESSSFHVLKNLYDRLEAERAKRGSYEREGMLDAHISDSEEKKDISNE